MSDNNPLVTVTVSQDAKGKVLGVRESPGKYGINYHILMETLPDDFPHQITVSELKTRVDKELQFVGLNRDTIVGRVVRFWKKPMQDEPTKGFFSIQLLDADRVPAPQGPLAATVAKVAPSAPPAPQSDSAVPGWLDTENKEAQYKERARADFAWAWETAWTIMNPRLADLAGDPIAVQAVQAAAIGLCIRLEHDRSYRR